MFLPDAGCEALFRGLAGTLRVGTLFLSSGLV